MAQKLFSSRLAESAQEITNPELSASLNGLMQFLRKRSLKILAWDNMHIAIPLNITVELPPLGNADGIDIRSKEPVLVVIDTKSYPGVSPMVYPDRLDFPKDSLAHLYVAVKDKPPGFCLVRGSLSEWYSNKQLKDLVIRIGNWLRDAAAGELSENGAQFDPLRLEGYTGTVIYDYDQLAAIVNDKKSFFPDSDFAIGFFERKLIGDGFSFKLKKFITSENLNETYEDFKKENEKDNALASKKYYNFGYIVWSNESITFKNYCINLPEDWENFKTFCARFSVDTEKLENQIATYDLNTSLFIPVIVAIKRPKTIIGFSGSIEFLNFYLKINTPDVADGRIINNIPVAFQSHNQPLSLKKAKEISGFHANLGNYSLIAGCGALGSKIIMHLARSGSTSYLLVDPDELSPHNLIRHALFSNAEGLNKAVALKKEITNMYPYQKLAVLPINKPGDLLLTPEITKPCSWILDFTASNAFFHSVVKADIADTTRICRVFISDFGNLGIMLLEGKNRNPRIDDLQVMLYTQYKKMPFISSWLKRETEGKENNVSITVGVGCNSETTILADDIVSLHGAFFSGAIKSESHKEIADHGRIYLNEIQYEPFFSNLPKLLDVRPMVIMNAINDPAWQIRMKQGILETMKKEMGLAMPHEIGGVFVGCVNYKTKTVHVVDLIPAPADSMANHACFFRGIQGLPEAIGEVNEQTGNQLGYIGEWHSHPFGPNAMSNVDLATVRRFKSEFENSPTPLPVFLMIVSPTHILPYVF